MPPSLDKDRTRARFSNVKRRLSTKRAAWLGAFALITTILAAAIVTTAMHGHDALWNRDTPEDPGPVDPEGDADFPAMPFDAPVMEDPDRDFVNASGDEGRNVSVTFRVTNNMNESVLLRLSTRAYSQLEETVCQPERLPVPAGATLAVECTAIAAEGDEVVLLGASWFTSMNDTLPEAHSRYYVNLTGDDVSADVFVFRDGVVVFDPDERLVGADRTRR